MTATAPAEHKPDTSTLLPLGEYDTVIVSYSGGKDSLACLLHLLELGVDRSRLELWHQHVDGEPGSEGLMDWPCTEAYVRATGEHFGLPVRFQWRHGGFEGEMLRENRPTAGVSFEDGAGRVVTLATTNSPDSTRRKFPQVSADLSVRWCSSSLKISVCDRAITNDPRFTGKRVLVVTGERRQESAARSKYATVTRHKTTTRARRVDQWRAVLDWSEREVWEVIARHRVEPHPAYKLGWGRVSCLACIFGDADQWAGVRGIAPERFDKIAAYEKEFGCTIKKGLTVIDQADKGRDFTRDAPPELVALAMGRTPYTVAHLRTPEGQEWATPAGAYKRCGGPT